MPKLSVTIVTLNEEQDLPGCLASVAFADELVVVDSGSTDRTQEIARAAGAKVFVNPWPGDGPQKAFALERTTGDWVLNLDADERCSPELAAAIPAAIGRSDVDGYQVLFRTFLFGQPVRHGGFGGERHLRLFRRAKAKPDARVVHGNMNVDGRVENLDTSIVHHPYASLDEYFEKFNRYTTQMAKQRADAGKHFSKWSALRLPWSFFRRYVLQLGVLDGYAGFLNASLAALYDFMKYAKLADLERQKKLPAPAAPAIDSSRNGAA